METKKNRTDSIEAEKEALSVYMFCNVMKDADSINGKRGRVDVNKVKKDKTDIIKAVKEEVDSIKDEQGQASAGERSSKADNPSKAERG